MRARSVLAAITIGATTVVVGPLAQPASATVSATTAGTVVTVTATGDETITFSCSAGGFRVNGVAPAPPISCSALTQVTVAGDSGAQQVTADPLGQSVFTARPRVVAALGGGNDSISETPRADQIDTGLGDDVVSVFHGGVANTSIDLGGGIGDQLSVSGTDRDDTIAATSSNATVTVNVANSVGSSSFVATNVESLVIAASGGNDTVNTTAITGASTVDDVRVLGGAGNDSLLDGAADAELFGGSGTNTLSGGPGRDSYWSESHTDTLQGGDDDVDEWIYDTNSLRSGGRALSGFTAIDTFVNQTHQGDVMMRVRPGAANTVTLTTSLTRPGQQLLPAPLGIVTLGQSWVSSTPHRGLADVVLNTKATRVTFSATGGGILDVTVPAGTWTMDETGSTVTIESSAGFLSATSVSDHRVHGPWTNKDQGFAHRATRDLLFRFASDAARDQIRDQLAAGTRTRSAVAQSLMNTDEYRGLDVDRVFQKYLRRVPDPGGRSYWISALRNGRALWRFRAQLFGSNEYFNKAGATNASYVAKAYSDVLGRAPDPSGQTYWTNKLNNGADRGWVALQFLNSLEARRRLVDDQFLRFLDRLPTSAEQATWVNALPEAGGEQALIHTLVSGSAYYNRS